VQAQKKRNLNETSFAVEVNKKKLKLDDI